MMQENEEVPAIEKLDPHEFDLDVEEQARLQAEGESEVERVSLPFFKINIIVKSMKYKALKYCGNTCILKSSISHGLSFSC